MKIRQKRTTLGRYLFSYLGAVLLACAAISQALCWRSMAELNRLAWQELERRVQIAASDVESQCDALFDIAAGVGAGIYYRPMYVERNKYYELERIADFAKYKSYSALVSEYYCLYSASEIVYSANAKFDLSELCRRLAVEKDQLCPPVEKEKRLTIVPTAQGGTALLFILPMRLAGIYDNSGDISLIFAVPRDTLRRRVEDVSGLKAEDYALRYGGQTLLGAETGQSLRQVDSPSGLFSIQLNESAVTAYAGHFLNGTLLIGGALTLLMLCFGAAAAYSTYYPIKRVADRLGAEAEKDKLLSIEHAIARLEKENSLSKINLNERMTEISAQKRQMRQQLLSMLLSGVHTADMARQMELAGLDMPYACFAVIGIDWQENNGKDTAWLEETLSTLRDEGVRLYGLWRRQSGEYNVLVNFEETEALEETADILSECLESKGLGGELRLGRVCGELRKIPISLVSAQEDAAISEPPRPGEFADGRDPMDAEMLHQELRAGDRPAALSRMHRMLEAIDAAPRPEAMRRCLRVELLNRLLREAEELELAIAEDLVARALEAPSSAAFSAECGALVNALCESRRQMRESAENTQAQGIAEYIAAHITDPQLSIAEVADRLGLGNRQVGRGVLKYTGMPYKEYVARQKIELAKRLLVEENRSVEETSALVCYANAAYFIKVFKEMTGYTPGQYKKKMRREEDGDASGTAP